MRSNAASAHSSVRPVVPLENTTPHLRIIEGKTPKHSIIPLTILGILVLAVAVIIPLILNTQMAERSFEIRTQQLELNRLDAEAWTMTTSLREASSPLHLEKSARDLGMVPAASTGFVTLSTGTVEGGTPAHK